jgi:hypothetical protein
MKGEDIMAISSSSMPRTAKLYMANKKIDQLKESKSRGLSPEGDQKNQAALQVATTEKEKLQFRLNFQLLFGILLGITVILAFARALFTQNSIFWLFEVPPLIPRAAGDFATILTSLLAISVAIERLLETAFNWFEQTSIAVADVLVAPKETLDWIGREYQDAYQATDQAADAIGVEMTPESLQLLDMAEDRLAKAEERLRSWVNAPEYLAWKKALCIWFGLLAGLIISVLGDLGMLRLIQIPVPRILDMIVTGLVIGSGPGPMHDLIGLLHSGKDALGSLAELAKGKSVQAAVEEIRKSEAMQARASE